MPDSNDQPKGAASQPYDRELLVRKLEEAQELLKEATESARKGRAVRLQRLLVAVDMIVSDALAGDAADCEIPERLRRLLDRLVPQIHQMARQCIGVELAAPTRNRLVQTATEAARLLSDIPLELLGTKRPAFVYDPGEFRTIAHVIAVTLLNQKPRPLTERAEIGSGIYALFYDGDLPCYQPIRGKGVPIYVGSAEPKNSYAKSPEAQGRALSNRLAEHLGSIRFVEKNPDGRLRSDQLTYRCLFVKSGWELAAEQYLIKLFRPVWNKETRICEGLGKHGDASTTRDNRRSSWDTLHPGRPWTLTLRTRENRLTPDQIQEKISTHFEKNPPKEVDLFDVLGNP